MNKMNKFEGYSGFLTWFMAVLLSALAAGCGGGGSEGRDPILGVGGTGGAALAPTVTAVTPLANATGVPINTRIITAAFSKAMNPATLNAATFTLACPGYVAGGPLTYTYVPAGNVATLTLPALPNLPPSAVCTATVTTGATDTTGIPLASNFVWIFTTGLVPDTTRPVVSLTVPANAAIGVATNTAITAVFSEEMAPATITAASFTVTCVVGPAPCVTPVVGVVTYVVGSRTAVFTPAAVLEASKTYTATIAGTATDLAGNLLVAGPVPNPWNFTTAAAPDTAAPVVNSTNPANGALNVPANQSISATFSEAMNAVTVTSAGTFTLTGPGAGGPVVGVVSYDALNNIATFNPNIDLAPGVYTARIAGGATGAKDLAGNALVQPPVGGLPVPNPWSFTVAGGLAPGALPLGSASTFGALTCAALVGSTAPPTGTTVNGDIGTTLTSTSITNFVGGGVPATPGIVNGTIFASDLPTAGNTTSATAIIDANTARLAGATAGALGTLVPTSNLGAETGFGNGVAGNFFAGAYRSGSSIAIATPITLNAQGDANAVWIFFMPVSTLTTTGTGNVLLANGAQAKNVFWVVGSTATLGAPTFNGSILAGTAISVATVPTTVNGRLLTSGPTCAAVTFDANIHTVNVPAP